MTVRSPARFLRKYGSDYLSILPFYALFSIFGVYPLIYSIIISLNKWNANKPWVFVGLKNYSDLLFKDTVFWTSLYNVVFLLLLNVPLMIVLSILIAVALNSSTQRFKDFFRIVYLLPYVASVLSISVLFYVLFDDQMGTINLLLKSINWPAVPWLSSPKLSKVAIDIVVTWKWIGYNMIIALAGLQSISTEIYDSVKIDGAGKPRIFFQITLPLLRPVMGFQFIMATIGTLTMFSEPFILTAGGPGYSSLTPVLYLYRTSFKFFALDRGAAIAVLTFFVVLIPSIFQIRLWAERDGQ